MPPDFPPRVRYLVIRADADRIGPGLSHTTAQAAQQEIDGYWARCAPDSPRVVVEAVTTYRVVERAEANGRRKNKTVPAQRST